MSYFILSLFVLWCGYHLFFFGLSAFLLLTFAPDLPAKLAGAWAALIFTAAFVSVVQRLRARQYDLAVFGFLSMAALAWHVGAVFVLADYGFRVFAEIAMNGALLLFSANGLWKNFRGV
jgi:hypothetical protein